jgi:chitinase
MFSIGGWSAGSEIFSQIAANASSRSKFAQGVLQMCNKHDFDGFDLDWEVKWSLDNFKLKLIDDSIKQYPCQHGGNASDKANFVMLLREMKNVLSSNGKILSIAVVAPASSASQSYDIPSIAANVDFINLM